MNPLLKSLLLQDFNRVVSQKQHITDPDHDTKMTKSSYNGARYFHPSLMLDPLTIASNKLETLGRNLYDQAKEIGAIFGLVLLTLAILWVVINLGVLICCPAFSACNKGNKEKTSCISYLITVCISGQLLATTVESLRSEIKVAKQTATEAKREEKQNKKRERKRRSRSSAILKATTTLASMADSDSGSEVCTNPVGQQKMKLDSISHASLSDEVSSLLEHRLNDVTKDSGGGGREDIKKNRIAVVK